MPASIVANKKKERTEREEKTRNIFRSYIKTHTSLNQCTGVSSKQNNKKRWSFDIESIETMYKIFTSLWAKSSAEINQEKRPSALENETMSDEDDWVFISPTLKRISTTDHSIVSPTFIKTEQPSIVQQFNPIENLLIEHASRGRFLLLFRIDR